MLRKALRAGLKAAPTRYYVYGQNGRTIMGNPEPRAPPKDIYQYHYAFDSYPDQHSGFKYRKHDKYILEQTFAFEVFEFKYDGQQWDIGSLSVNILYFLLPLFIYIVRKHENEVARFSHGTRGAHYQSQGGFLSDTHIYWQDDKSPY